ncbi:MAG: ArsC family transcriptional regulator [Clostridia bacterium]|nr:ArsC family transcriptional regulator [Clostridia bacterium]
MTIQIFGKKKCFDTKKAERYFKERRISVQNIDMISKGMSLGELRSVLKSIDLEDLIDENSKNYHTSLLPYTSDLDRKLEILTAFPDCIKTPIVRNGNKATLGYHPEIWDTW